MNPSLPLRAVPHAGGGPRPIARWVAAWALVLTALAAGGAAAADPPSDTKHEAKPSSFAPHHTKSHVYGTPVGKPVLHKQKKRPRPAPAAAPAEPIR
jgi:hypothetical protein